MKENPNMSSSSNDLHQIRNTVVGIAQYQCACERSDFQGPSCCASSTELHVLCTLSFICNVLTKDFICIYFSSTARRPCTDSTVTMPRFPRCSFCVTEAVANSHPLAEKPPNNKTKGYWNNIFCYLLYLLWQAPRRHSTFTVQTVNRDSAQFYFYRAILCSARLIRHARENHSRSGTPPSLLVNTKR